MQRSTKHSAQQHIVVSDFTDGLNATTVAEMIGDKQLSEAINVEIDRSTGFLRTCCGTAWIYSPPTDLPIHAMLYDKLNGGFFFVSGKDVYQTNLVTFKHTGSLTGDLYPIYTDWEDGFLVSSGDKLQYWNGKELLTLVGSPAQCDGVYVRAGRVLVYYDTTIRFSAVGDETNWTENNNDDSASKFIEIGYKDGGRIIGIVNLSQDILIIKDNRRVYRLSGEYPNWTIREVSRNVECLNRLSFCAVTNSVLVLGKNTLQLISTTQDYGEMAAQNVAENVINLFNQLSLEDSRLIYIPPLNQVWIISCLSQVIVYDLNYNAYFERRFNSKIVDILCVNDTVFIIRKDKVTQLMPSVFHDEKYAASASPIAWSFKAKRLTSFNEYLLKRIKVSYIPLMDQFDDIEISVGQVKLNPKAAPQFPRTSGNTEAIYGSTQLISPITNQCEGVRQIYRNRCIDVQGHGKGSAIILNKIEFDIVEV